jgi:hypothetical protein
MRPPLTDQQMYEAAKRNLDEHLALRRVTDYERMVIVSHYREQAEALRFAARSSEPIVDDGPAETHRCQEVSRLEWEAARLDNRADGWNTADYDATTRELAERMMHYHRLVSQPKREGDST